jgi:folate-dependent tRNA-U54 methylase TrmFO/GidA
MRDFQPVKANFGILPQFSENNRMDKRERATLLVKRAQTDLAMFLGVNKVI